jgi:hypothetical protein
MEFAWNLHGICMEFAWRSRGYVCYFQFSLVSRILRKVAALLYAQIILTSKEDHFYLRTFQHPYIHCRNPTQYQFASPASSLPDCCDISHLHENCVYIVTFRVRDSRALQTILLAPWNKICTYNRSLDIYSISIQVYRLQKDRGRTARFCVLMACKNTLN